MNKKQEDKLSMYYAVQKVCNANNATWNKLPAFVLAFGEFTDSLSKLEDVVETQVKKIAGVTQDKTAMRKSLMETALEIGNAVFAYASDKKNATLKDKVNFSETGLVRERDTVFIQHCQRIVDETAQVIEELGNYGVVKADLEFFQTGIKNFTDSISLPRAAITERKGATGRIEELLREIDDVLYDKMDRLMDKFKKTSADFYKQYFDVRSIVSHGVRHKKDEPPPAPAH